MYLKVTYLLIILLCLCAARSLSAEQKPTHNYHIILRVITPKWRKQPTAEQAKTDKYQSILSLLLNVKDPHSDAKVLKAMNNSSTIFQFDAVKAKMEFDVSADQIWTQPEGFSMHDVKFSVVERNPELILQAILPTEGPSPKVELGDHKDSIVNLRKKLISDYSPASIQKVYGQGKFLIYSDYTLCYHSGDKRNSFLGVQGPRIVSANSTFFFTYDLHIENSSSHIPVLSDTDIILMTILEKH